MTFLLVLKILFALCFLIVVVQMLYSAYMKRRYPDYYKDQEEKERSYNDKDYF